MNDMEEYNLNFCENYLAHMLDVMDILPERRRKDIMEQCSECHYTANNMDELLSEYVGNIEGFIEFLTSQWGWKITYDKTKGILIADENKSVCVCPIVAASKGKKVSSNLCYCSEGFAARMFSKVSGHEVKTKIVSSILRGDEHCVYEIVL
jgi:predicted hydrocarbon binding protein